MRRKRGELSELVKMAIEELSKTNEIITSNLISETIDVATNRISTFLVKLEREGKIEKISRGYYKIKEEKEEQKEESSLERLANTFDRLNGCILDIVSLVIESIVDPEKDMLMMIQRREERIKNLEYLLHQAKSESGNARQKIDELTTKINRLAAEKLRVIPETKVVYKDKK